MINIGKSYQKNVFFTLNEWEFLIELALKANQPIGSFLIKLAHQHAATVKDAK